LHSSPDVISIEVMTIKAKTIEVTAIDGLRVFSLITQ
jgi:hypothetical protein